MMLIMMLSKKKKPKKKKHTDCRETHDKTQQELGKQKAKRRGMIKRGKSQT